MLVPALLLLAFQAPAAPIDNRAVVLQRIHSLCPGVISMDRKALLAEEHRLATEAGRRQRALPGRVNLGADWLTLGCLRAKLSFVDIPGKPQWGITPPEPWANQAIDALISGLNLRPDHPIASELLAAVAIDATELPRKPVAPLYEDIAVTLERSVLAGSRVSSVMRGCTAFELMIADTAAARYCTHLSLDSGIDSTWHLLRWALVDLRHGDSSAALGKLQGAIAAARTDRTRGELAAALGAGAGTATLASLGALVPSGINYRACDDAEACAAADNMHGMHNVHLHTALYRLWDPRNGRPIGLVTYGLRRADLLEDLLIGVTDGEFLPRRLGEPRADLFFRQWDPAKLQLTSRLATIEIKGPEKNMGDATGYLFVASSETSASWSMTVTTFVGRRGHLAGDAMVPLDTGPLAVSDPVFGAARDSVIWTLNERSVVLAPLDAIYRDDTVYLYYQVRSDAARPKLATTLLFYRKDAADQSKPLLQLRFDSPVKAGLNEIQRELNISRLVSGEYRLVLVTDDPTNGATSRQERRLVVK